MTLLKKELTNNDSLKSALMVGKELLQLIPQREPIVMIDTLYQVDTLNATTGLSISKETYFVENNTLREAGIIEHMAQSSAAFAGYDSFKKQLPPQLGFIGEVKKMSIQRLPLIGEKLITQITKMADVMGVTLISAKTYSNDACIAQAELKIFLKE